MFSHLFIIVFFFTFKEVSFITVLKSSISLKNGYLVLRPKCLRGLNVKGLHDRTNRRVGN